MVMTGFLALAAAATGALSVGATVVRPEPQPALTVQNGAVTVRNAGGVIVSARGGTARRLDGATVLVTPGGACPVTITFTY